MTRLPLILAAGIVIRLAVLWIAGIQQPEDSAAYLAVSHRLAETGSFAWIDPVTHRPGPFAGRTPGMHAIGAGLERCLAFSPAESWAVVSLWASWLTIALCFRLGGPVAAWCFALSPVAILMSVSTLTDSLFCLACTVALLAGESFMASPAALPAFGWGAAVGLACLVKPISKLYWVVGYRLIKRPRDYMAFLAGLALVVAPWILRNSIQLGSPILEWGGGRTSLNSITHLVDEPTPREWTGAPIGSRVKAAFHGSNIFRAEYQTRRATGLSPIELDGYCFRMFAKAVTSHPVGYLRFLIKSAFNFFTSPGAVQDLTVALGGSERWQEPISDRAAWWSVFLNLGVRWFLLGLFATAVFKGPRDPLLLGTLFYYALLSSMVVGYDRYRLAIEPVLFVMLARKGRPAGPELGGS